MSAGTTTDLGFGCGVIDGEGGLFKFDQYRTGLSRKRLGSSPGSARPVLRLMKQWSFL